MKQKPAGRRSSSERTINDIKRKIYLSSRRNRRGHWRDLGRWGRLMNTFNNILKVVLVGGVIAAFPMPMSGLCPLIAYHRSQR